MDGVKHLDNWVHTPILPDLSKIREKGREEEKLQGWKILLAKTRWDELSRVVMDPTRQHRMREHIQTSIEKQEEWWATTGTTKKKAKRGE